MVIAAQSMAANEERRQCTCRSREDAGRVPDNVLESDGVRLVAEFHASLPDLSPPATVHAKRIRRAEEPSLRDLCRDHRAARNSRSVNTLQLSAAHRHCVRADFEVCSHCVSPPHRTRASGFWARVVPRGAGVNAAGGRLKIGAASPALLAGERGHGSRSRQRD